MIRRFLPAILPILLLAANPRPGRAEHAKVNLEVTNASGEEVASFVDQTPPEHGKNPRPSIRARVGEPIKVRWAFTNVYPHKTLENVVVHFYVARQGMAGQKEAPDLAVEANIVFESAIEMDFKPGAKAGARNTLSVAKAGNYLIRVESRGTGSDHEHFAAIDLIVEAKKR